MSAAKPCVGNASRRVCRFLHGADDAPIDRDDERRRADQHRVFAADDDFARRAGDEFHGRSRAEGNTRAGRRGRPRRHFFDAGNVRERRAHPVDRCRLRRRL